MHDLEWVLGPSLTKFAERHCRSLLSWDILLFFYRNPDAVLDLEGLASRLGRRVDELEPEVKTLCDDDILQHAGGLLRFRPKSEIRELVIAFGDACQDRSRRLALIALVLHKVTPRQDEA